jgi:hypothetical protein
MAAMKITGLSGFKQITVQQRMEVLLLHRWLLVFSTGGVYTPS